MGEIRGIRPQILTFLGLPAALRDLAVAVAVDLPERPPEHVEAHTGAGAGRAEVSARPAVSSGGHVQAARQPPVDPADGGPDQRRPAGVHRAVG